ncbi:MAG: GntR family transcriptional regulator [Kribbellaceae bacterium]
MSRPTTNGRPGVLPAASRRQQVLDVLREEVVTGKRKPGEQLKQDVLAGEFGVSPGPVREALRHLESEGLVEHVPNYGVYVADINPGELMRLLLPVRLAIETYAVPLAAQTLRSGRLDDLERLVDQMDAGVRNNDLALINDLDVRFHEITVEAAGSLHALQLWRSVQPRIRALIYRLAPRHTELAEIPQEHRQLLDAIRAQDEDTLRKALEEHIIGTAVDLLDAPTTSQDQADG